MVTNENGGAGETHADGRPMETMKALRWPPPGLERVQGDLLTLAGRAGLAGILLVAPLLWVTTRVAGPASLGPLADAWWITVAAGTIGLAFGLDAMIRAARTLRRCARAIQRGYDVATVVRVLADVQRDMGFLLVGARHFSTMDVREREAVVQVRMAAALLLALAGVWMLPALSLGLLLASKGALSIGGLRLVTLAPAALAYVAGGLAYVVQERRVRQARTQWHQQPWAEDLVVDEIREWRSSVAAADSSIRPSDPPKPSVGRVLSAAGVGMGFLAVLVTLPVLTLVPASAIGPVLASVSAPGFERYRPRAARAEAFRSFAIDADPAVSPQEAGRLLHLLMFPDSAQQVSPGLRAPVRASSEPWIPSEGGIPNPFDLDPFLWGDSLLERVGSGVTPGQRAFLLDVSLHPLADDFARLARAPSLDAATARWETPFAPGLTMATVPVPSFGSLRQAANARIGAAAFSLSEGNAAEAERILAEVIAVGFLLADQGPTLIDNLVGYAIVEAAGSALGDLFRVAEQPGAAAALSRLREVAGRAADMMPAELAGGTDAWVRSLPGLVLDTTIVRGLRWEYFINLTTVAPCLNMNRMVFGANSEYHEFIEDARESLVRWPSEEPLFDLARRGWVGASDPGPLDPLTRIGGLFMSSDENSCARLLRHMSAGYQP